MHAGMTLQALFDEVLRQHSLKLDLLVPQPLVTHETIDGHCSVIVDGKGRFAVSEHALRQMAEGLKIPYKYFDRMRTAQPALLDANVNTWLREDKDAQPRMLRTLDGNVRAWLSNRYLKIEYVDMLRHVLPELRALDGCEILSCQITDTRLYIKAVSTKVACEVQKGDVVQAGVVISNSEVGCGRFSVEPLVYRLVCTNGLIVPDAGLKRTHLGTAHEDDGVAREILADDTLRAADEAFFLKVRDVVRAAVSEAGLKTQANRLAELCGVQVRPDVDKMAVVEVIANRFDFTTAELNGVFGEFVAARDWSAYGLVNAVTGHAKEVADYDRSTHLEKIGGQLLDFSARDWRAVCNAA